jgi:MFS family permease
MVVSFVQMLAVSAPNMQWQPFFACHWAHQTTLGYLWIAVVVALMIGAWLSKHLVKRVSCERRAILVCVLFTGIGIALTTLCSLPVAVLVFSLHEVARGALGPLQDAYLQKNITASDYRATLGSVTAMGGHIGGAIGLVVSGFLAQYASITTAWVFSGVFLISSVAWLWRKGE